jgi:hypothetical protein
MTGNTFKVLSLVQGGSLMVEHLTSHPKVKVSSPAAAILDRERENGKRYNLPLIDATFIFAWVVV